MNGSLLLENEEIIIPLCLPEKQKVKFEGLGEPTLNKEKQNRMAFIRRRKESKQEYLLVETENECFSPSNRKIRYKKEQKEKLEEMNNILEDLKKSSRKKFVYEAFCDMINEKIGKSSWHDYEKDFEEKENYQQLFDSEDSLNKSCFLEVVEMTSIEKAFKNLYTAKMNPLKFFLIQKFLTLRKKISEFCLLIIKNPFFDLLTLIVIIANCITIILDKSEITGGASVKNPTIAKFDDVFFSFYIFEVSCKVFALGFIMNEGAYLKDNWNQFDFFIISMAILSKILLEFGIDLPTIRSFRVIRPLKLISNFKSLQSLLESLISALPLLANSFLILFFCYLLYAIAGLHLFSGLLKKRCIYENTGLLVGENFICGNVVCGEQEICSKLLKNPNYGIMNFDNIFYSLLNVFQIVTMNNWTAVMYSTQKAFTNFASIFFVSLVIIGGFFLVNLTLAIVKYKFSNIKHNNVPKNRIKTFDYLLMKKKKMWISPQKMPNHDFFNINSDINKNKVQINHYANLLQSLKSNLRNLNKKISRTKIIDKNQGDKKKSEINSTAKKNLQTVSNKKLSQFILIEKEIIDENLDPKYLKLQINFKKPYISLSENEVLVKAKIIFTKNFFEIANIGKSEHFKDIPKIPKNKLAIKSNKKIIPILKNFYVPKRLKEDKEKIKTMRLALFTKQEFLMKNVKTYKKNSTFNSDLFASLEPNLEKKKSIKKKNSKNSKKAEDSVGVVFSLGYKKISELIKKESIEDLPILKNRASFNNEDDFFDFNKSKKRNPWSGNNVLVNTYENKYQHIESIINSLNSDVREIYARGFSLILFYQVKLCKKIAISSLFDYFIFFIVLMNGIILCLEGIASEDYLNTLNLIFTFIYTFELIVKFIGLGINSYFKDHYSLIDFFIVFISYNEIFISIYFKGFQYLRVIKCIRIFRLFKILRKIDYLKKITNFIFKSFSSYICIASLLLLINFVYGLMGMDLFMNIKISDPVLKAYSFDEFSSAFITALDILIMDNWYNILSVGKNSDAGLLKTSIYAISWIFIGNYILMNLLLAIVLDGLNYELNRKDHENESELEKKKSLEYSENNISNSKINIKKELKSYKSRKLYSCKPNDKSIFKKGYCTYSLFLFGRKSLVRQLCDKIVSDKIFEILIFVLIALSNIRLIIDTYMQGITQLKYFEYAITSMFTIECLLKIIAQGFFLEQRTYLRESWNQLDFFIVIVSLLDMTLEQFNLPWIKVVRILRVLRPLRLISSNPNIKIVVVAMLESLYGIFNVSLIIFFLWIIFSGIGISIYKDRFGYCEDVRNFNVGIHECLPPQKWVKHYDYNFDNIYYSMFTLLAVSTYDGWMPILDVAVNSNTSEYGPTHDNSQLLSYFYFVAFIVVIPIFFINLFIGVIFYHYANAEKKIKYVMLTASQVRWIELQKLIIALKPKYSQTKPPSNPIRKKIYNFTNHSCFEAFVILIICCSIINLSLFYDDAPSSYLDMLALLDFTFLLFFIFEIFLKLFALGVFEYFHQIWNKFDFFVALFGLVDLYMNNFAPQDFLIFRIGPKILRALRILRIGRLLRLIKKFDGILKLLKTLSFSLPMILNVLGLILLIFFIFTIIGCSMFSDIYVDDYINFQNFLYGLMTLFKISTSDSWTSTVIYYINENPYAAFYFISFVLIIHFIAINLFILVLLQQFDDSEDSPKHALEKFHEYLANFRKVWVECTNDFKGRKMRKIKLIYFFKNLDPPIGFKNETNLHKIAKIILEMKIKSDNEGFVYFNELLFKTMKNVYGFEIYETDNKIIFEELKNYEKKTSNLIKSSQKNLTYKTGALLPSKIKSIQKEKDKPIPLNPLKDYLYFELCFSAWKNYILKLKKIAETDMNLLELLTSSESDEDEFMGIDQEMEQNMHFPSRNSENNIT